MAQAVVPLMLAGTVMSAVGATQSATAQKNAALYNARLEEINALTAADQTSAEVNRFQRESERQLGSIRANLGATGSTDDALSVLADVESRMELDRATLQYRGDLRAQGHRESANLNRTAANVAGQEGALRSASAFLSGIGNTAVFASAGLGSLNRAPAGAISRSFLTE